MSIIRQLELTVVTLVLMSVSALAGIGWGIFIVAAAGGYAISQYDSGFGQRSDPHDSVRCLPTCG